MARIEPKYVAESNNVKYTINPNNNYWVVLDYVYCNLLWIEGYTDEYRHELWLNTRTRIFLITPKII
jgi:hypothetical protein